MDGRTPRTVVPFAAPSVTLNNVGFSAAPNYGTTIRGTTQKNDIETEPNTLTNHHEIKTLLACTAENNQECRRVQHKYNWPNAVLRQ